MDEILSKDVEKSIEILNNGGVSILPTDTVYGIGALPIYKKAIMRIYEIKEREFSKKIIALIDDISVLKKLIDETDENMEKISNIIKEFWPGELTIIFKANKEFIKKFDDSMETIGVRIPKNKKILKIIENVGNVILVTSANISGEKNSTKLEEINKKIIENVDCIVEDDTEFTGKPSTIIKYENGEIYLLREGNIKLEKIKKLLKG